MTENTPNEEEEEEPKHISRPILKTSPLPENYLNFQALHKWPRKIIPFCAIPEVSSEELRNETQQLIVAGILWTDGNVIVSE